jgi:integrase
MTVKVGLKSEENYWENGESRARDNQILDDDPIRKIIKLSIDYDEDGDFALLVILLAATGARFCQLKRMRVCDVQLEHSRILVPSSFKGKGKSPALTKSPWAATSWSSCEAQSKAALKTRRCFRSGDTGRLVRQGRTHG